MTSKKAAAFFAKEINQRLIRLSNNTGTFMASVGYSSGLGFFSMIIIIFSKTANLIIMRKKKKIQNEITTIYHEHEGVVDYRTIHAYLGRKGIHISLLTTHKYMNTELQLFSVGGKRSWDTKKVYLTRCLKTN